MKNQTALITGASSGIGYELARQFAQHGHSLVLVAPNKAELDTVAQQLEIEHGVTVAVIAADLTSDGAPENIFAQVESEVEILCNNAGFGARGKFDDIPLEKH